MISKYILEIVNCVIEFFIAFYYFNGVCTKSCKTKPLKWFIIFSTFTLHTVRSYLPLSTYTNFAITAVLWGINLFLLYDDKYTKKLLVLALNMVAMFAADIIARFITSFAMDVAYAVNTMEFHAFLPMVIFNMCTFFILSYFIVLFKSQQIELNLKYRMLVICYPLFSSLIIIFIDILMISISPIQIWHVVVFMCILSGLVYTNSLIFDIIESYNTKIQLVQTESLLAKHNENYKLLEENELRMKQLRHDLNEHLQVFDAICHDEKYETDDALKGFAKDMSQFYNSINSTIYTKDSVLDSVLNIEAQRAMVNNIKFLVKTHKMNAALLIEPVDKSTILSNAINNAIEACLNLTDDRFIIVEIASTTEKIHFNIKNSSPPIKISENSILSTKMDKEHHGFGISIIKQTLEKYNGFLQISHSQGITQYDMVLENTKLKR